MNHYACAGECHGMSDVANICHTPECSMNQKDMVECHCDDGMHSEVIASIDDIEKTTE